MLGAAWPTQLEVVDSHTAGEPTRVVLEGWPQPAGATLEERRAFLLAHQDPLRRAVVSEPRGHAALVGALLTPPVTSGARCGVVFFDNAGGLGMCGHGLIGLVRTLHWLGRLQPGTLEIDTPVGTVGAELHDDLDVTIRNVPAFVHRHDVTLELSDLGRVRGDVAWGGNWFFVTDAPDLPIGLPAAAALTLRAQAIKRALKDAGVTGSDGAEVDHVELCGSPRDPRNHSRNFVLCPGDAFDRSPCGTGTSAKLATLFSRGRLSPGEVWRQESIVGGVFEAWLAVQAGQLVPHVRGRAFVTGRAQLHLDPLDPFRAGFA